LASFVFAQSNLEAPLLTLKKSFIVFEGLFS